MNIFIDVANLKKKRRKEGAAARSAMIGMTGENSFTARIAACLSALCLGAAAPADDGIEWSALARADIEAAHQLMLDNHPGPVDSENPDFNEQAALALETSLDLAEQARSEAGYIYALRAYNAGFHDGHFGIFVEPSEEAPSFWPGFVTAWRAGRVIVSGAASDQSELIGSELLVCGDKDAEKLMRDNIFRFDTGKPDQPAYWGRLAPRLFLDEGNPFVERAKRCTFRKSNGRRTTTRLDWRETDDNVRALRIAASFGERPAPGLHEFAPGRFWANLPNFSPNGEEEIKAVQDSIAAVREQRDTLLNAEAIVVDIRGNQGGNNVWGEDFVDALWGEEYRHWRQPPDAETVDWRASAGNLAHLEWLEERLIEEGHVELLERWLRPVTEGVRRALANGKTFYSQPGDLNEEPRPEEPVENPVKAPVYFLTHGFCASSCLDFADLMLSLEGVTHIGYPTSSDTTYLEIRFAPLPSGKAQLVIPLKVYRGRRRGNGEYYDPAVRYDGLDWSDEAIEAWVSGVIDGRVK